MPDEQTPEQTAKPAAPATAKPAPKVIAKPQAKWNEFTKKLAGKFKVQPNLNVGQNIESILLQDASQLVPLMTALRDEYAFAVLLTINAIEYKEGLQVVYQLQSLEPYKIFVVRVNLDKNLPTVSTLTSVWGSADWYEREIWDMQGIVFDGHPNLTRLLNPSEWEGHPMRKNYIPPIDALNGPITTVKPNMGALSTSKRADVEIIEEPSLSS